MTLHQQQKTVESLRLENQHLNEENEKLKESLCQTEQSKQTEGEADLKDKSLRHMSRQNEELRKKVAKYEKELEIMSQKFSVLYKQTQDQTSQSNAMSNDDPVLAAFLENGKRKEVAAKTIVSEANDAAKPRPSTLQECREMCAGTTSRYNMQQMKNKILFAEAKRTESKNQKDSDYQERIICDGAMAQQKDDDFHDKRRQPYGTTNSYETMAKLTASKLSVTHSNVLKQKSPLQVRKPLTYKGLKKNPRWGKKTLR
ncbi:centrosomal protein of 290 kDa-like isoform X1 [Mercenaria mercenaria]|uniref:centrosomal protein of 290 kDa-like isoform X1 n=1 Tax=Mercenaria mercenaria TaxID=6596 RepID=UPI00234F4590|nr:centrosomal protein of 290 kDa-like isoform X1 [Mercenaria mercenaria]